MTQSPAGKAQLYSQIIRLRAQIRRKHGTPQRIEPGHVRPRIMCDIDRRRCRIRRHRSGRSTRVRIRKQRRTRARTCAARIHAARQNIRQRIDLRLRGCPIGSRRRPQRHPRRKPSQIRSIQKRICHTHLRQRRPRAPHMRCVGRKPRQRIRRRNRRHLIHRRRNRVRPARRARAHNS
jgi:hypothetical protein